MLLFLTTGSIRGAGLLLAVLWGTHCARNQTQAPACKAHALPTELSRGPLLERGFILGRTEELQSDTDQETMQCQDLNPVLGLFSTLSNFCV